MKFAKLETSDLTGNIWGKLSDDNGSAFVLKSHLSRFSTWRICSREQAKSECDWLVMSSVFLTGQSGCFSLCSRKQIRLVENRL